VYIGRGSPPKAEAYEGNELPIASKSGCRAFVGIVVNPVDKPRPKCGGMPTSDPIQASDQSSPIDDAEGRAAPALSANVDTEFIKVEKSGICAERGRAGARTTASAKQAVRKRDMETSLWSDAILTTIVEKNRGKIN
jgi:hypothetical protein